jgi:HEPN domain-containing protein
MAEILLLAAERDQQAFDKLADDPNLHDSLAGFHAQQAVEKALKAVLAHAAVRFRRTHGILEQLEQTREDLLALSDDIWLSIDHNDSQALEEGVAFKKQYNAKVAAFDVLAGELSALVQQFTAVKLDAEEADLDSNTPQGHERKVHALDQHEPRSAHVRGTFFHGSRNGSSRVA